MKKILVAVDGSPASIQAARKARELAQALDAELTLIHVQPVPVAFAEAPMAPVAGLAEAEQAYGAGVLNDVASALGGEVRLINMLGAPAETIAETALVAGFDLVVVGSKGRGTLSRVLLGSVADRVLHLCQKAVLVVPVDR